MGLALERKNLLTCRSERVKAVDFHPTEPWVLSALYNGTVTIRNYQTNSLVKTIEVCDLPVRTAKFIARKNWIVCGSDDLTIRVFNYNTMERVTQFSAHSDYIRSLAIHPTRPFLLSASDDLTIKLWDWERAWKQIATFEGHSHYVMALAFNPKDSNVFASASLDKTIKMWSFNMIATSSASSSSGPISVKANYTLSDGHEKGINCIDFYTGSDRPFLVTGSDDFTVRIWDYHTKSCVRVLEGHSNNVSAVAFHPQLPLLLTASEDGGLRIWNSLTFRPESSYSFGMERAWSLATNRAFNMIAIGFDAGTLVMQLGRGDPAASLDPIQGRLVWSRARGAGGNATNGNEILTGLVRIVDVEGRSVKVPADGEIIPMSPKELGTSDVFPQFLQHSPDGRMVAVWGDGEYVIYSTIGWRNRAFGRGQEIVWSNSSDMFAVRESASRIVINRLSAGAETTVLNVNGADRIYGNGPLLGVSIGGSTLCFYDWTGSCLVRVIDVAALSVNWSPDGSHVAIITEDGAFLLAANGEIIASPQSFPATEDGIEDSLELVDEIEVPLKSLSWIHSGQKDKSNCFVYLTMENRMAYHVIGGGADESFQIALFDRPHFMLGFLAAEQRVYVCDQDLQVSSFAICGPLIAFQSAVLECPESVSILPPSILQLLPSIPSALHAKLAVFLNRSGFVREALKLSPDADFKFTLAVQLGEFSVAQAILASSNDASNWCELGRAALKAWNLRVAEEAFIRAADLPSLFLLYAAGGDAQGLERVAKEAQQAGQVNLAFSALFKAGNLGGAFDLLMKEERPAEAAIFARSYGLAADKIAVAVREWRAQLKDRRGKAKLAQAIADPLENAELFSGVRQARSGRSVSFDGNVSVVGGGLMQLKAGEIQGFNFAVDESVPSNFDIAGAIPIVASATASTSTSTSNAACSIPDYSSIFSDDHMSLEVNTAGTGAKLEDLDECEGSMEETVGGDVDLDNLGGAEGEEGFEFDGVEEALEEAAVEGFEGGFEAAYQEDYHYENPVEEGEEIQETPVEEAYQYEAPSEEVQEIQEAPVEEACQYGGPAEEAQVQEEYQFEAPIEEVQKAYKHEAPVEEAPAAEEEYHYEAPVEHVESQYAQEAPAEFYQFEAPTQQSKDVYSHHAPVDYVEVPVEQYHYEEPTVEHYQYEEAATEQVENAYKYETPIEHVEEDYQYEVPIEHVEEDYHNEAPIEHVENVQESQQSFEDAQEPAQSVEPVNQETANDFEDVVNNQHYDSTHENLSLESKSKKADDLIHEEIDFGGEGDADGWL